MSERTVDVLRRQLTCTACGERAAMRRWPAEAERIAGHLGATKDGVPDLCAGCFDEALRHPTIVQEEQTFDALDAVDRPAEEFVRWPYADVDALAGPMAPGQVWYLAAASGGGKTTMVTGCVRRWTERKVPVAVLPLETRGGEWRVGYVCQSLGISPGDALSGRLAIAEQAGDPVAARQRALIRAQLRAAGADPEQRRLLYVADDRNVTEKSLRRAAQHAADHGFRVLIVDHIDHVGSDDARASSLDASKRVNHALLDVAQTYGLVLLPTSQLNASRVRGSRDRLQKYAAPATPDLYMHTFKEHVAAGILGLFRPTMPDADPLVLKAVREGLREPMDALEPLTMGVAAMKLRHLGANEGRRAFLALESGAPRDRTEAERRDWEQRTQGIRTGDETTMQRTSVPVLGVVRGGRAA